MPLGIGLWEIVIVLVLVLIVFGPKRLPEMGRSLGRGLREFKDSISGSKEMEDFRNELPPAEEEPPAPAPRRRRKAVS